MTSALVVIDMQEAMLMPSNPPHDRDGVVDRIAGLLARARTGRVPVIYVQHDGGAGDELERGLDGWKIHAPIAPQPGEPIVEKRHTSAFQDTDFESLLKPAGIDRLVLCGMQSDFCVDATTRAAAGLGYEVVLVSDAHTTFASQSLTAAEVQARQNQALSAFARCVPAAEVQF
jgi:nicotinamidase-related amidase